MKSEAKKHDHDVRVYFLPRTCTRHMRIMLEKVADSARKAVKLAEPYKPYGEQFFEFCSISLSTYQTCMKLTRKSTELFANFSAGIIRICLTCTTALILHYEPLADYAR